MGLSYTQGPHQLLDCSMHSFCNSLSCWFVSSNDPVLYSIHGTQVHHFFLFKFYPSPSPSPSDSIISGLPEFNFLTDLRQFSVSTHASNKATIIINYYKKHTYFLSVSKHVGCIYKYSSKWICDLEILEI